MKAGILAAGFGTRLFRPLPYIFPGPSSPWTPCRFIEYAVLVRSADVLTDLDVPDADRPCLRVVTESTDAERARLLVEEFRDRIAACRKEPA